ncbi:hypothetical protein Cycma_2913 [Cyclobacterium marinum DSM 745]|uniref:Uncharacterized protein n=1 Tax=Cyclobacterium marinum (strain ATCC 25205 / DSM 745 / LMG 13164 / NCIMB 1802) TaxID=880070 RepID=G0J2R6_CYCMS|nr:hypothetical protein Cycma_2913 [Cyclobacterium marinum DSM 745]
MKSFNLLSEPNSFVTANLKEAGVNFRAYEQKLHIRRICVGDVAKEIKAQYCTEHIIVNGEATRVEGELP